MKCKTHFTMTQIGETQPFIDEILLNLTAIICDLNEPQVHVFYEALGHIISSEHDEPAQTKLIEKLMVDPNRVWADIIEREFSAHFYVQQFARRDRRAPLRNVECYHCDRRARDRVDQCARRDRAIRVVENLYVRGHSLANSSQKFSREIMTRSQNCNHRDAGARLFRRHLIANKFTFLQMRQPIRTSSSISKFCETWSTSSRFAFCASPHGFALTTILQTNTSACKSIGIPFIAQIQRIFEDMLAVYRLISSSITQLVSEQGVDVLKQPLLKQMRSVKRETLTVLSTWIARAETHIMAPRESKRKLETVLETMAVVVIPALFSTILQDYSMSVAEAREPKILSLLSITILSLRVSRRRRAGGATSSAVLQEKFSMHLERMFELVFMPTLEMIKEDTSYYPEHRVAFFQLIDAAVRSCFDQEVMGLPENIVSLVVQAILWAIQHTIRVVAEIGASLRGGAECEPRALSGILLIVEIIERLRDAHINQEQRQQFYQRYYVEMLTHVIGVVTDHNQVPFVGLANLSEAVCQLFACVESDIKVPLGTAASADKNIDFVSETIGNLLAVHFPNLTQCVSCPRLQPCCSATRTHFRDQIRVTIKGFFSYNRNTVKMRDHIRDFLVQIKVCKIVDGFCRCRTLRFLCFQEETGADTADLFLEDKEKELQRIQAEKSMVPGIQNPHDIEDDEQMN